MKKIKGFTLAEVLITLTILGVVAAIAVPNVISGYKKKVAETRLKEVTSILYNALDMAYAEKGPVYQWLDRGKSIVDYVRVIKQCNFTAARADDSCFNRNVKLPDNTTLTMYTTDKGYMLPNGMSVLVTSGYYGQWNGKYGGKINFYVDIDGPKKGPHKFGQDIFAFAYIYEAYNGSMSEGKILPNPIFEVGMIDFTSSYGKVQSNNSYSLEKLMSADISGGCNEKAPSSIKIPQGSRCAAAIMRNGWKIPKDYPIKF